MPSRKEPEEGDEPEPKAGGRRRRHASRRHRALVPSKELPLEEEAVTVRKPICGEREFTKVGTIVLCSAPVSATVYVGSPITATGAARKPCCCCSVILL
ncbi:hypothetical protein AHAS_Ahas05G0159600 [Arachis hypogaea]